MSANTADMMAVAHQSSTVAVGAIALIFALGVGLYLWSRPRR